MANLHMPSGRSSAAKAERMGGTRIAEPQQGRCPRGCTGLLINHGDDALVCLHCGYEHYTPAFRPPPAGATGVLDSGIPETRGRPPETRLEPCEDCGTLTKGFRCRPCRSDRMETKGRDYATQPCAACGAPTTGVRCRPCVSAGIEVAKGLTRVYGQPGSD